MYIHRDLCDMSVILSRYRLIPQDASITYVCIGLKNYNILG